MCECSRMGTQKRRGFTLIEMLVVIAIIAILAGMAAWAVYAMVGGQERRNTESTIKVVNKVLQAHWAAVIAEAEKDDVTDFPTIMSAANNDVQRAKVILKKCRLVEAFPETYAEIATPWIYANGYIPPGKQRYISSYQATLGATKSKIALTESSACLLMALSIARAGGATALSKDKIGYAVFDSDGDGIPELIDSFENPKQALAFFRFAWNFNSTSNKISMQGSKAAGWTNVNPGFNKNSRAAQYPDPIDADGTLVNPAWHASGNRKTFEMYFHPVTNPFPPAANPPFTGCYVMPVIVSAGPGYDKATNSRPFGFTVNAGGFVGANLMLAMQPDMSVAAPNFEADNIYSFQLAGN